VDEQDPDFEDTLGDFPHHGTLAMYTDVRLTGSPGGDGVVSGLNQPGVPTST
jgi:hypothetical protein